MTPEHKPKPDMETFSEVLAQQFLERLLNGAPPILFDRAPPIPFDIESHE